jgi:hypothetical protein
MYLASINSCERSYSKQLEYHTIYEERTVKKAPITLNWSNAIGPGNVGNRCTICTVEMDASTDR